MKKEKTEIKIYLPLLGSLILVLLIFNFFTKNLWEVYKRQEMTIRKIKEDLALFSQKEEILNSYSDYELNEKVRILNFILPKEKNAENLIYSIEKLVNENSVNLLNMDFSPGILSDNNGEEKFQVKLGINGNFLNIKSFLEDLKKAPITVEVLGINLNFSEEEATDSACNAEVILNNYFKAFSLRPEGTNQPLGALSEKERIFLGQINLNFFPEEGAFNPEAFSSSEDKSPF